MNKKGNAWFIVIIIIIVAIIAFLIGKYGIRIGPGPVNPQFPTKEGKATLILEWNSASNDAKPIINQISNKMNENYNKLIIKFDPKKGIKLPAKNEVEEYFKSKYPNKFMTFKSIYAKDE